MTKRTALSFLSLLALSLSMAQTAFVKVNGTHFEIDGKPYYYMGTNYWYGANVGSKGQGGDRARLDQELDELKAAGVLNLRVVAGSEGPDTAPYRMAPALQSAPGVYNQEQLDGLDYLLAGIGKREMKAVVCLNNFWPWSGGFGQYMVWSGTLKNIPYPPPHPEGNWDKYQKTVMNFYDDTAAVRMFNDHIKFIVNRTNTYTKKAYKEDATIMAWELANEPRGLTVVKSYQNWIEGTSKLIKILDKNHLVTTGSEGNTQVPAYTGLNFKADHQFKSIDYMTMHVWVQNWGWYDPMKAKETYKSATDSALAYINAHVKLAQSLGKPVVLEEFGISRDANSYNPSSSTKYRDKYYATIFKEVHKLAKAGTPLAGCNFWAYAGKGRPKVPYGLIWEMGHDFVGDPPHENQGWYSVYNTDLKTIKIIAKYSLKLKKLNEYKM